MSIPLYAAQAHGGKIYSLDDQSVVKDLAALAGTGGNAYAPYLVTAAIAPMGVGGFAKLRKIVQRVPHDGAVTVAVRPYRDGSDTGQTISRTLASNDNPTVTAPVASTGSTFQFRFDLSTFSAVAALGAGEYGAEPKRSGR